MELMALETARDFSDYMKQDHVKAAFETLPDEVRKYILTFADENEQNLGELSHVIEDVVSEIGEAVHRMDDAANAAGDAEASVTSALDGLGRLA